MTIEKTSFQERIGAEEGSYIEYAFAKEDEGGGHFKNNNLNNNFSTLQQKT